MNKRSESDDSQALAELRVRINPDVYRALKIAVAKNREGLSMGDMVAVALSSYKPVAQEME